MLLGYASLNIVALRPRKSDSEGKVKSSPVIFAGREGFEVVFGSPSVLDLTINPLPPDDASRRDLPPRVEGRAEAEFEGRFLDPSADLVPPSDPRSVSLKKSSGTARKDAGSVPARALPFCCCCDVPFSERKEARNACAAFKLAPD